MGFGDDIMASGFARNLHLKGMQAAFGDGKRIIWGPWSEEIFRNNPNVARPGSEGKSNLHWIDYYKGHRNYNTLDKAKGRWIWNYDFRPVAGQIYFEDEDEIDVGEDFILVEPNVPWHKSVAVNKDWGLRNYQAVADRLIRDGFDVVQSRHGRDKLERARFVTTPSFRNALWVLSQARVALVPEGGLHHGAAAVGTPAVVIFGGFIPPMVTGYSMHVNFTGDERACGSLNKCNHCLEALARISVEEVYAAVLACASRPA